MVLFPAAKAEEPVKLVHLKNVTSSNVEGHTQVFDDNPHENGISSITSVDTGSYSGNTERCSYVTGGYDKSVVKRKRSPNGLEQVY